MTDGFMVKGCRHGCVPPESCAVCQAAYWESRARRAEALLAEYPVLIEIAGTNATVDPVDLLQMKYRIVTYLAEVELLKVPRGRPSE